MKTDMDYEAWASKVFAIIYQDWDGYTYDPDYMDDDAQPMYRRGVTAEDAAAALLYGHKQIILAMEAGPEGQIIH